MCFGVLAACGSYDDSALLNRIAQLEQELNAAKNNTGTKGADGEDGITPHIGNDGYWYFGITKTEYKAQGEKGDPGEAVKIYYLGETFTYICAGIPLFSITIIEETPEVSVYIIIKNLNITGHTPNDFVSLQGGGGDTQKYSTVTFSDAVLPINEEFTRGVYLDILTNSRVWRFGFPALKAITPYAIFDLN